MTNKKHDTDGPASVERRRFLEISTKFGFTAAVVAGAAGALYSPEASAQMAQEEKERQKAADHVMTIGTAYILGATRSYPIMQLDFKENIQKRNARQGVCETGTGWSAWCWRCVGAKSAERHHSGSSALAVELCAVRTCGRPDQLAVFLWCEPKLRQFGELQRLENRRQSCGRSQGL